MICSTSAARQKVVSYAIGIVAILALLPASAIAASQRTFVASYGSDASPNCALLAPCRSFNAAITQTSGGGEVVILDTAGYGPMVISKSIKVIGPAGVYGGISVIGGANPTTGIIINAGDTDDVILRGLDITGVPGSAPLPLIGIDIQNAGAVYIEKSSISNFPEDGGACIQLVTAKSVRVFVDDSFLRHCLTGIHANGTAISSNRSGVYLDNTRIERGFNSNPASTAVGLWMQGFMTGAVRSSVISRMTTAVRFDSNLTNASNTLDIINSELATNGTGLLYAATADNGSSTIRIVGSQVTNTTNDAISIANSAVGRNTFLTIGDSVIGIGARLIALTNTSGDAVNARMVLEMDNTRVLNANTVSVDLNAPNGAKTHAFMRDSTFAQGANVIKTRGGVQVSASLIRSEVNNCAIVVDHGAGVVRLDGNHIVNCSDDFVNNGSGNIVSDGRNLVHDIPNTSGFTYITPTAAPLK